MCETYGEYTLDEFLHTLRQEKRLVKRIFYDDVHKAWFVVVEDYKKFQPKQLKLFEYKN